MTTSSTHTLSVLVENKPGVLARIASLFSPRGFNISSLAVGETEHPEVSRMTVVVDVEDLPLEQVTKQLNKLVEVLKVVELEPGSSVQRQVMLIKVRADAGTRSQVLEMVQMFRAKVVDVATESLTIEATSNTEKLRELEAQHDELTNAAWDEAYIRAAELDSPNSLGFEALRWRIYAGLLA